MIDFRYHIVSIIAIFLALGVGIILGSTVLENGTVAVLRRQTTALGNGLDSARADIRELRGQRDRSQDLSRQLGEWVAQSRLQGQKFVTLLDGGSGRWRDGIRDGLVDAGAQQAGSITLTGKWNLETEGAAEELTLLLRSTLGSFDPGARPADAALTALGRRMFEPDGHTLLRKLADARFLTVDDADLKTAWPVRGSTVLALASTHPKTAPQPAWLSALALGTASAAPTLVVSASPQVHSAVTVLRDTDVPPSLATFDSGESDMGRVGSTLSLGAATRGSGGHFGTEPGRRQVPEPG